VYVQENHDSESHLLTKKSFVRWKRVHN